MIKIISKKSGFWRAGVQHSAEASYTDDFFTKKQLRQLKNEPLLIVTEDNEGGKSKPDVKDIKA